MTPPGRIWDLVKSAEKPWKLYENLSPSHELDPASAQSPCMYMIVGLYWWNLMRSVVRWFPTLSKDWQVSSAPQHSQHSMFSKSNLARKNQNVDIIRDCNFHQFSSWRRVHLSLRRLPVYNMRLAQFAAVPGWSVRPCSIQRERCGSVTFRGVNIPLERLAWPSPCRRNAGVKIHQFQIGSGRAPQFWATLSPLILRGISCVSSDARPGSMVWHGLTSY